MAKAKLHAADGAFKSECDLPDSHFEQPISEAAMYNAVDVFLGNQRQGTHKAKNSSLVSGGGKKPWKQKGTGRARQGSIRASHWVGGGKAMGPKPRDYFYRPPKKVRKAALAAALSMRAQEKALIIVSAFDSDGKSKKAAEVLTKR